MKVICHFVANINDFLPFPSNAHLHYKSQNKSSCQMPSHMSFWVAGIHQYSPPSSDTATSTSMFKETVQEIYTIHELKSRKITTLMIKVH